MCVVGVISVPGPYPDSAGASVSVGVSVAGIGSGAGAGAPPLDTYIAAAVTTQAKWVTLCPPQALGCKDKHDCELLSLGSGTNVQQDCICQLLTMCRNMFETQISRSPRLRCLFLPVYSVDATMVHSLH